MEPLDTTVFGRWPLNRKMRQGFVVVSLVVYVLLFPVSYPLIDHFYFVLGLLPIIAAGLLLGFWAAISTVVVISITHFAVLAGPVGTPLEEAFVESIPLVTLLLGGTIGYLRDLHVKLAYQREELKRQNERLDEFASIVSHDLRNPLNVATGRVELAREECDSEHLDAVDAAHDRMETLIQDVLMLAREGEEVKETQRVDLASLTESCWHNVVTTTATLAIETDVVIHADGTRLQQLLENLIRNAVEHGGDDVTVTVGDLPDGFYIADTGPGIPEEKREDVFEPGQSTSESGTGFGLSIVQRIAQAHEWSIDVTDSSDGGARFEVTGVEVADN